MHIAIERMNASPPRKNPSKGNCLCGRNNGIPVAAYNKLAHQQIPRVLLRINLMLPVYLHSDACGPWGQRLHPLGGGGGDPAHKGETIRVTNRRIVWSREF